MFAEHPLALLHLPERTVDVVRYTRGSEQLGERQPDRLIAGNVVDVSLLVLQNHLA